MGNKYTLSAFKHSSTWVTGIQSLDLNMNMQQIIASGSGAVDPSHISIGQMQPEIAFDTTAIKIALAGVGGIDGAALSSDIFFFQRMAAGGKRTAGSNHTKVTAATGIIVPTRLMAPSPNQPALLSYRVVPTSADGEAAPIAIAGSQAFEAGQDLVTEQYVLGPVSVNGSELDGVESWQLDFGIQLEIVNNHVYPTFVAIQVRNPVITIQTTDIDAFESWGIEGDVQGATDSTLQLKDQTEGGARGSSPITFSIDAGMIAFNTINGRHGQLSKGPAALVPTYDGTNEIIAVSGIS